VKEAGSNNGYEAQRARHFDSTFHYENKQHGQKTMFLYTNCEEM